MAATTAGPAAATPPWLAVGPADAPAIVFLHGTRLTRAQWLPQVRRLSDRFRCIAVDLPGHGARAGEPFTMAGRERRRGGGDRGGGTGRPRRHRRAVARRLRRDRDGRTMPRARGGHRAGRLLGGARRSGRRGLPRLRLGARARPERRPRRRQPRLLPGPLRRPDRGPHHRRRLLAGRRRPGAARGPAHPASSSASAASGRRSWSSTAPSTRCSGPAATRGRPPAGAAATSSSSRAMHLANLDRPGAFSDLVAAFAADPAGTA